MKVFYAREQLPKSIFLAGPTPRSHEVDSWRPSALKFLESFGFNGSVFVPEDSSGSPRFSYDDQVKWEWEGIDTATAVLFWIPREISMMPAFTTNIEYGYSIKNRNLAIGWPDDTPKNGYLDALAMRYKLPVYNNLHDTVMAAMMIANNPFEE